MLLTLLYPSDGLYKAIFLLIILTKGLPSASKLDLLLLNKSYHSFLVVVDPDVQTNSQRYHHHSRRRHLPVNSNSGGVLIEAACLLSLSLWVRKSKAKVMFPHVSVI